MPQLPTAMAETSVVCPDVMHHRLADSRCSRAERVATRTDGLERRALVVGEQHEVARLDVTCGSAVALGGGRCSRTTRSSAVSAAGITAPTGRCRTLRTACAAPGSKQRAGSGGARTMQDAPHVALLQRAAHRAHEARHLRTAGRISRRASGVQGPLQPRLGAGSLKSLLLLCQGGQAVLYRQFLQSSITQLSQRGGGGSAHSARAGRCVPLRGQARTVRSL